MDINRIKELAFDKMGKRKPHNKREEGYIFYHGLRTAELAIQIREMIDETDNSKDNIKYVASLFHDIAKGIEPHTLIEIIGIKTSKVTWKFTRGFLF